MHAEYWTIHVLSLGSKLHRQRECRVQIRSQGKGWISWWRGRRGQRCRNAICRRKPSCRRWSPTGNDTISNNSFVDGTAARLQRQLQQLGSLGSRSCHQWSSMRLAVQRQFYKGSRDSRCWYAIRHLQGGSWHFDVGVAQKLLGTQTYFQNYLSHLWQRG